MKLLPVFLLIMAILGYHTSGAQKIDSASLSKLSPQMQQQVNNHLKKSKKAKTIAFGLLAGGLIFETVAVILEANETNNNNNDGGDAAVALLAYTGAAAILVSVPFFIKAHRQKEMARLMVFGDKPVSIGPGISIPRSAAYGIKCIIPVGK